MARYVFQVDALPSGVFTLLLEFLSTFDLLSLSHVNSALISDLLACDSDVWKQRLHTQDPALLKAAKKDFYTRRTFQFPGILNPARGTRDRGGAIALPNIFHHMFVEASFSISLWFALQSGTPETRNVHVGGVLIGALSRPWSDETWAFHHEPFIHVDEDRNLYCSMTDEKEIVAHKLKPERWYHAMLTFHRHSATDRAGTQSVYVDGTLVHTSVGALHPGWRRVPHMQLGSGCITGGTTGAPRGQSCWYAFRGVIANCSFWYHPLSPEDVQRLSQGDDTDEGSLQKSVWSLRVVQATAPVFGDVEKVRCLPPAIGRYVEIARSLKEPTLKSHLKLCRTVSSRR